MNGADRKPPHNPEAERSILGAVMLNNAALDRVMGVVAVADFFLDKHRLILATMIAMASDLRSVDLVTVKDELTRKGKLEEAGGAAYVASLTDGIPDIANVEDYAEIVREDAARRRLISIGHAIEEAGYQGGESAGEVAAQGALKLSDFAVTEDKGPQPISVIAKRSTAALQDRWERAEKGDPDAWITGIRSGLKKLDANTLGFQRGALSLLAARPKGGKSALANEVAIQAVSDGLRVLLMELDMPERMVGDRFLCRMSGVNSFKIRTGSDLLPRDWQAIAEAELKMTKMKDRLVLDRSQNIGRIASLIRSLARNGGMDLFVIDHVGLVRGGKGERRDLEIADICARFIAAAAENNAVALGLVQLSRKAADREPILSDLKDSGSYEEDAREIILMDRPHYRGERTTAGLPIPSCQLMLQVAKNEGDETGWFPVHLDTEKQRVTEEPFRHCSQGCPYEVPQMREQTLFG